MLIRVTVLSALSLLFTTGCGFEQDFSHTVKVLFESDGETCRSETKSIDLNDEKDFIENKNLVKSIAINDIVIAVTNPNVNGRNEATQADGSLGGAKSGTTDIFAIGTYEPLQLAAGSTQTLTVDPTSQARVSDLLLSDESRFDVVGSACADKLPYSFETEFTINMTVAFGAF